MEIYSNKKISRETNFSNTELKIGNFSARWILREIDVCQFSVLKNCHFEKYYTSELWFEGFLQFFRISIFRTTEIFKILDFGILILLQLSSRKIWVAETHCRNGILLPQMFLPKFREVNLFTMQIDFTKYLLEMRNFFLSVFHFDNFSLNHSVEFCKDVRRRTAYRQIWLYSTYHWCVPYARFLRPPTKISPL